jgi:hypothetical protein
MRGRKGSTYDGGIHVPCFLRWPGTLKTGTAFDRIAAHIDIAPTVLEACGVSKSDDVKLDGVSLWPLLTGKIAAADWHDRTLFLQWHRGDAPDRFRAFAARSQQYKLVRAEGPAAPAKPAFELFDMSVDPYEQHDLAATSPQVLERLKAAYSAWFDDVSRTRGYEPPRIFLGLPLETPTTLTRQDWRGPRAGRGNDALGYWEVEVKQPGEYRVTLTFKPDHPVGVAHLLLRGVARENAAKANDTNCVFEPVRWDDGPGRLEAWLDVNGSTSGAWTVEVSRLR